MDGKIKSDKYKKIFDLAPVGFIQLDCSSLSLLAQQLKEQTVTNIRQYLSEHPALVKKAFLGFKLIDANAMACELLGNKSRTYLLRDMEHILSTEAFDSVVSLFVFLLEERQDFTAELKFKAGGAVQDLFLTASNLDDSGAGVILTLQDISPWKRIERQLRKRSQLDGLTNLYNHTTITQRLEEELLRAQRYGLSMSCLMVDLDHFKVINDKYGHQKGDQVLKQVANKIKDCVRKVDPVGRYGGDEFLIILPETKAENAKFVATRIQNLFASQEFRLQRGSSFKISLSIGIAGFPIKDGDKVGSKDLIALADRAMYSAKKAGRNRTIYA